MVTPGTRNLIFVLAGFERFLLLLHPLSFTHAATLASPGTLAYITFITGKYSTFITGKYSTFNTLYSKIRSFQFVLFFLKPPYFFFWMPQTWYSIYRCSIVQRSLKKNQNAPRPSEHPPVMGKNLRGIYTINTIVSFQYCFISVLPLW